MNEPRTEAGRALPDTVEHHLAAAMNCLDDEEPGSARTHIVMATVALNRDRAALPVPALDALRLAEALVHWDVDDETFRAQPTAGNIEAWLPAAEQIIREYAALGEDVK